MTSDGYLADTSVFVSAERGDSAGSIPPGKGRISVVTLTELRHGVLAARTAAIRANREETLKRARRFIPLAYDERVADLLATLLHTARLARRRAPLQDSIIAATALAHDLTVLTHDSDFDVLTELEPKLRIQRA